MPTSASLAAALGGHLNLAAPNLLLEFGVRQRVEEIDRLLGRMLPQRIPSPIFQHPRRPARPVYRRQRWRVPPHVRAVRERRDRALGQQRIRKGDAPAP